MVKCPIVNLVRGLHLPNESDVPSQHRSNFRRIVMGLANSLVADQETSGAEAKARAALEEARKLSREVMAEAVPSRSCAESKAYSAFKQLDKDVRRILRHGTPKPEATKREKGDWVTNWRKLVNKSLRETTFDLSHNLARAGFMDRKKKQPTLEAIKQRVARVTPDGRVEWSRTRWISIARKIRQTEKRNKQALAGAAN